MFSRIALAVLFASPFFVSAEVTNLSCTQTSPTEYKISYALAGDSHKVQIFSSDDPAGIKDRQLVAETAKTEITVRAGKPGERMYFFLKPDQGREREVSIRRLPLEGTPNFRDVGGYETTDGRFVRWGMLYRSGVLSPLTASDLQYLSQLKMRVVCDFRTKQENEEAPEKWVKDPSTKLINLPIGGDDGKDTKVMMERLVAENPTPAQLQARMAKIYGDFALKASPQYAAAFKQLEEDHLPLVYHCTAGKDRTGVFTALVLLSLGVPEKTVIEDYTLTNKYFLPAMSRASSTPSSMQTTMARLTPEQRHALMIADPEALRTALHTIDEKYGSFDNYRRQALGVSDADLEKLRERLLVQ
jgi:protein-tyrosine phosphatase